MDRQYFVESIIDASEGDESYSYAIVCVEQCQARTVCMGVQSRAEAQKIANGLTWYETFLEGSISMPPTKISEKPKRRKRAKE